VTSTPTQPVVRGLIGTWVYEGACADADPKEAALFWAPEEPERASARRVREAAAKAFCSRCPVVEECLRHALRAPELYGIWGGMNENERRGRLDVRRGRPRKTDPPAAAAA
jgi:WhiB family transcriptional regulator, redox-sensing transcriptional regulator